MTDIHKQKPTIPQAQVISCDEGKVSLELTIPETLAYLEGHFPDEPIVPGVAQIDWAVTFSALYLQVTAISAQSFQVKFRQIFGPGVVQLSLEKKSAESVRFVYEKNGDMLSAGTLQLA